MLRWVHVSQEIFSFFLTNFASGGLICRHPLSLLGIGGKHWAEKLTIVAYFQIISALILNLWMIWFINGFKICDQFEEKFKTLIFKET